MRLLALIFPLAALGGCVILQPTGGSGSGVSTTTGDTDAGPAVCQPTTTCADCTNCALNGPCSSQAATCNASADCLAIDQCEGLCGFDATCKQQCLANNPAGASAYTALTNCVDCDECATQCAGLCSQ